MGAQPFLGRTLGHYRIVEQIGVGGMGVVYRAYDEKLDRQVALKMMMPGALADDAARRRFRQEALAISRLSHPNIATVFDFDTQDGVDFLVTELITGGSLADKLTSGPLSEPELLPIAVQIAAALEDAHEHGVLHRDLKPSNIMLTAKAHVKLLDFGLAKLLSIPETEATHSVVTGPGVTAGTVPYMSPEQLRGEPLDARSDIWSFGVILYEMCCGRLPFEAKTGSALAGSILHEEPPKPRALNPSVSAKLEAVVLRCLKKAKDARYRSMKEVLGELKHLSGLITVAELAEHQPMGLRKRWLWIAAGLLMILAGAAAWWQLGQFRKAVPSGPRLIRTVAVLPLENLSGDPKQDYFADGLTEALIADLSRVGELKVISRTSVMQYKGVRKPLPQIARELGADGIIEGSVIREGDNVRVTVQMIDGVTDEHLWANSYNRELRGILALQSEVARAIANHVQAQLTGAERKLLETTPEVDPEAHEAYMLGLHYLRSNDPASLDSAVKEFEKAIARQPGHALSHVGMAEAYVRLSGEYRAPHQMMPKARSYAEKALALDPALAEAHIVVGAVQELYDWDLAAAEASYRRALDLKPNLANAHGQLADLLSTIGRHDEAIEKIRAAERLDPRIQFADWLLYVAGRYEEAIASSKRTSTIYPENAYPHAHAALASAALGRSAEAIAEAETALKLAKGAIPRAMAASALAQAGQVAKARQLVQQLEADARKGYVCSYNVATVFVALREVEKAIEWLERGLAERTH